MRSLLGRHCGLLLAIAALQVLLFVALGPCRAHAQLPQRIVLIQTVVEFRSMRRRRWPAEEHARVGRGVKLLLLQLQIAIWRLVDLWAWSEDVVLVGVVRRWLS